MTSVQIKRKVLVAACGCHIIQDGLVALQFVLLPVLAQALGLSYAQVGLLRAIANTSMSILEVPSGLLAERFGERRLLVFGLVCAGLGYVGIAFASGFFSIAIFFFITGAGAAFQHALSSSILVNNFDGPGRRRALGIYNSSGDAGKLAFTAVFSFAVGAGFAWNDVVVVLSVVAVAFGVAIWFMLANANSDGKSAAADDAVTAGEGRWGILHRGRFSALALAVFIDSVVQAVFLTFVAFILIEKGVATGLASMGVVLALAGGMVGKFAAGFLAARLGDRNAFVAIQIGTLIAVALLVWLPGTTLLFVLPFAGLVIQGSSTVTYGSVAEFMDAKRQSRGYALIYTVASVSSVVGPFAFGALADRFGLMPMTWLLAVLTLITLPLSMTLAGKQLESVPSN